MQSHVYLPIGKPGHRYFVKLTNNVDDEKTYLGSLEIGGVNFIIDAVKHDGCTEDAEPTEADNRIEALGYRAVPRHRMTIQGTTYCVALYPADP